MTVLMGVNYLVKHRMCGLCEQQWNAVNVMNAFFKFELECKPKHTINFETLIAEIHRQGKATFQLSSCSKLKVLSRGANVLIEDFVVNASLHLQSIKQLKIMFSTFSIFRSYEIFIVATSLSNICCK